MKGPKINCKSKKRKKNAKNSTGKGKHPKRNERRKSKKQPGSKNNYTVRKCVSMKINVVISNTKYYL